MGEPVNLGPCGCCGNECRGWYCCPVTREIAYVFDCEDLEALGPCGDSDSSSDSDTNCFACFPSPMPTSLLFNFTDLGVSFYVPNDGGYPFGFIGPVPEGVPEFLSADAGFLSLCDEQPDGNYHMGFAPVPPTSPDIGTGLLTLVSCNPIVLEGTFPGVGHVIITE